MEGATERQAPRVQSRSHGVLVPTASLITLLSIWIASCAGPSTQRGLIYSPGANLEVVAIIDGDFLAALPQDDQSADYSRFRPVSLSFRPDQMLVMADAGSERVLGLPLDPGVRRQVWMTGFPLRDPQFLRTDQIGNVFVADGGQRLVEVLDTRFRQAGEVVPPFEGLGLVQGQISGIAFTPHGDLYLSDPTNGRIYRYDPSGRFLASFTGGEEVGWGELLQPEGMTSAHGGSELYVCDAGKRQISVFDASGMPLRVFGGTDLSEPWAIAVDIRGQSYVADRKGMAICIFDEQGRLIDKILGPPKRESRWQGPTDVVIRDSSLVVADPLAGQVVIMKIVTTP